MSKRLSKIFLGLLTIITVGCYCCAFASDYKYKVLDPKYNSSIENYNYDEETGMLTEKVSFQAKHPFRIPGIVLFIIVGLAGYRTVRVLRKVDRGDNIEGSSFWGEFFATPKLKKGVSGTTQDLVKFVDILTLLRNAFAQRYFPEHNARYTEYKRIKDKQKADAKALKDKKKELKLQEIEKQKALKLEEKELKLKEIELQKAIEIEAKELKLQEKEEQKALKLREKELKLQEKEEKKALELEEKKDMEKLKALTKQAKQTEVKMAQKENNSSVTVTEKYIERKQQIAEKLAASGAKNPVLIASSKLTNNKGFCLVEFNSEYSLIGYINEKVFLLDRFQELKSKEIRAKLSGRDKNSDRYLVRMGTYKAVVDVNQNDMHLLLEF